MRKYTFVLVSIFIISLFTFSFNINSASAIAGVFSDIPGCTMPWQAYSVTTGEPCDNIDQTSGCMPGYLFSPVTGKQCISSTMPTVPGCPIFWDQDFTIGSRGENVRAFQQNLKDQGFLPGKVDGVYGPVTERAKINYYIKCPKPIPSGDAPVISGVSGPQTLEVNQQGTWTVTASSPNGGNLSYSVFWGDEVYAAGAANTSAFKDSNMQQSATFNHRYAQAGVYTPTFTVTSENTIRCITTPCPSNGGSAQTSLSVKVGSVNDSSLTVLSPNGGETWKKGTTQTIKWQDNTPIPACAVGMTCVLGFPQPIYDITLIPYYTPCTGNVCPMYLPRPHTIATGTHSSSYKWSVGTRMPLHYNDEKLIVPDGSYTIQVCQTGTSVCDSSNSYFKITSNSASDFTITTPSPLPNAKAGWPYYSQIETNRTDNGSSGYTHTITAGSMPAGLTLGGPCSSNVCAGIIGAPKSAGKYTFTVTFNMSNGTGKASKEFIINVDSSNTTPPNLVITNSSPLPNAKVGSLYQLPLGVQGGLPGISLNSYNWSVKSGALPQGLYFSGSDQGIMLFGTPTMAGTYNFTLTTYFSSPVQSGSKNFTLTVDPAANTTNSSPRIISSSLLHNPSNFTVGQTAVLNGEATDADNDDLSWSVNWGDGPSTTGTCSSLPNPKNKQNWSYTNSHTWTAPGTYNVQATISDCKGGSDTHTFTVTVKPSTSTNVVPISQITTSGKFIDNLYRTVLQREPDSQGKTNWLAAWNNGASVSSMYHGFIDSPEFSDRSSVMSNSDYVRLLYRTVVFREADTAGLNSWVTAMEQNNYTKSQMLDFFLGSREFLDSILPKLNALRNSGAVQGAEDFTFTLRLKKGSVGNEVAELQKSLNKAGHGFVAIDGKFGSMTEASVLKLQLANGLVADGVVGPTVWAVLNK